MYEELIKTLELNDGLSAAPAPPAAARTHARTDHDAISHTIRFIGANLCSRRRANVGEGKFENGNAERSL